MGEKHLIKIPSKEEIYWEEVRKMVLRKKKF